MIKQFNLAWISVKDLSKAKKFFTEKLGLKVTTDDSNFGWAEISAPEGGAMLGLAAGEGEDMLKPGSNAVVTFTVDDIEATKDALQGKGVQMIGEIMEVPGHVKLQAFTDDDGNSFQLVQLL